MLSMRKGQAAPMEETEAVPESGCHLLSRCFPLHARQEKQPCSRRAWKQEAHSETCKAWTGSETTDSLCNNVTPSKENNVWCFKSSRERNQRKLIVFYWTLRLPKKTDEQNRRSQTRKYQKRTCDSGSFIPPITNSKDWKLELRHCAWIGSLQGKLIPPTVNPTFLFNTLIPSF